MSWALHKTLRLSLPTLSIPKNLILKGKEAAGQGTLRKQKKQSVAKAGSVEEVKKKAQYWIQLE